MTTLTPDAEGFFLSLRRPLSALSADAFPPVTQPFDVEAELALYRSALDKALVRIPAEHLEAFRASGLAQTKQARTADERRAYKRQAQIIFDHMVSRGLKPAGPLRPSEADPALEFLAIRMAVHAMLSSIIADEDLIESNRAATVGWMDLGDLDEADRDTQVLSHAFRAESRLYMEVMDHNGATERFLARQPGRAH